MFRFPSLIKHWVYLPEAGVYDEMLMPSGELRPHWKTFGSFLNQCTKQDFNTRADSIQRLLRDHGVTYNIYDDALGTSRPWSLDTLPFIVAQDEFLQVQRGLDQRGRLLNAILLDLYGPQKLIRDGLIPASLVHSKPWLPAPCSRHQPSRRTFCFHDGQ